MTLPSASFWDKTARRYAKQPVANPDAYEDTLARTRAYLHPTDHVLEIGCGTASTAINLAPHVATITASDFSAEMTQIGQEKVAAAGLSNVTCVQGVPGDASLGTGPYDAVIAMNLLHLLPDRAGDIQRVADILKPGGHFISKTGCLGDGAWYLWPVIKGMQLFGKAPFVAFVLKSTLRSEMEAAGFDILDTHDYPGMPGTHFLVAQKR